MNNYYHSHPARTSEGFGPVPHHIARANLDQLARAKGARRVGSTIRFASRGKNPRNDSTVAFINPNVAYGVGIHSHNNPADSLPYKMDLARELGWDHGAPIAHDWQATRPDTAQHFGLSDEAAKTAARDAKALERCKALWKSTKPTGEPMRQYLHGTRGLSAVAFTAGAHHALRFHPSLDFWEQDGTKPDGSPHYVKRFTSPAIIARITDCVTGETIGLHRTWITDDGQKHPLAGDNARKMKGRAKGGTVAFAGPDSNGLIAVAEGIESALAMIELTGTPCHAALSSSGIAAWTPPPGTRAVLIAHDDDANGVGRKAADELQARLSAMGIEAKHYPPAAAHRAFSGVNDWNDVLLGIRTGASA